MRGVKVFIDTNILVYAFTSDEPEKKTLALKALDHCVPVVSTQVIKEFANVLFKKTNLGIDRIRTLLSDINEVADVVQEDTDLIYDALDIKRQWSYSFYDSVIIAAARKANCQTLFSEDLKDGQVIDGKLTIINPLK